MEDKTKINRGKSAAAIALPAGHEIEQYTIEHVLGAGGFGITYRAEHRGLGKHFAIKEYFPQDFAFREETQVKAKTSSEDDYEWGLKRFLDEARMLARFSHQSIVKVHHIFETFGTAYLVLEYIEGSSMGVWLKELNAPPSQEVLDQMLPPLFGALAAVHEQGLLHRDIAPDNIYIRTDGTPVLLDFGSARDAIGQKTKTISAVIKSGYSPPEQYTTDAETQGPWTDIYALASTLYMAVTGKPPQESTGRQLTDKLIPAAEIAKGKYRESFLQAIDWALKLRPDERPQTVEAWRAAMFDQAPMADQAKTVLAAGIHEQVTERVAQTRRAQQDAGQAAAQSSGIKKELSNWRTNPALLLGGGLWAIFLILGGWALLSGDSNNITTANNSSNNNNGTITSQATVGELNWLQYKNPRFGFELLYPSSLLKPGAPPANGGGQNFESQDGRTQLTSWAAHNTDNKNAAAYLKEVQETFPDYRDSKVYARAENGFILTGKRAWKEYYFVVLLSCGDLIVNTFEFSYPGDSAGQAKYIPVFNRILSGFKASSGVDTPANCGSETLQIAGASQNQGVVAQQPNDVSGFTWSNGKLTQGIWTASVLNENGSELLVNCNINGNDPGAGTVVLDIADSSATAFQGNRTVEMTIDQLLERVPVNVVSKPGNVKVTYQHFETQETIGFLKHFVNKIGAGNIIRLSLPEHNIEEVFSLRGSKRALAKCLE